MEIIINIKKNEVYDDVAKLTGYVGYKNMQYDEKLYENIFTTDEDKTMLERFWDDTCNAVTDEFKQFISSINKHPDYLIVLNMPLSFDCTLVPSVESSLFSYFINNIVSKWFSITNKGDAEYYKKEANIAGDEIKRKIYYRKKPTRIKPYE